MAQGKSNAKLKPEALAEDSAKPGIIRTFLANNWVEFLIVGLMIGGGSYLITANNSLNREVGELAVGQGSLSTKLEDVGKGLSESVSSSEKNLSDRISDIDSRLNDLKALPTTVAVLTEKVNTISRDVDTLRVKLAEAVPVPAIFQRGNLTKTNVLHGEQRTSTQPTVTVQFRWELKAPVDPAKVIEARARVQNLPSEVRVDCEVEEDGKGCVITLTGPAAIIESLTLPIAATVLIEVAN